MGRSWLQFNPRRAPIVSVRIQADRYRALIDTGADVSLIAPELSLRLGLASSGNQFVVALSGIRQLLQTVQLPSVGFGNIDLEPCRAAVCQVSRLGSPIELILDVNSLTGVFT